LKQVQPPAAASLLGEGLISVMATIIVYIHVSDKRGYFE
jgi:hypothetical protein